MKGSICIAMGMAGSAIASLFGGWTAAMSTLLIFMAVDYLSGLIVAGVFKKSPKSDSGALESKAGWKGLCKKGMILVIVLVSYRIDITIGTNYVKDAVCIGFILNELLSLIENAGLMGVPIPKPLIDAVEILKNKKGGGK